jgi:hypothetical protein
MKNALNTIKAAKLAQRSLPILRGTVKVCASGWLEATDLTNALRVPYNVPAHPAAVLEAVPGRALVLDLPELLAAVVSCAPETWTACAHDTDARRLIITAADGRTVSATVVGAADDYPAIPFIAADQARGELPADAIAASVLAYEYAARADDTRRVLDSVRLMATYAEATDGRRLRRVPSGPHAIPSGAAGLTVPGALVSLLAAADGKKPAAWRVLRHETGPNVDRLAFERADGCQVCGNGEIGNFPNTDAIVSGMPADASAAPLRLDLDPARVLSLIKSVKGAGSRKVVHSVVFTPAGAVELWESSGRDARIKLCAADTGAFTSAPRIPVTRAAAGVQTVVALDAYYLLRALKASAKRDAVTIYGRGPREPLALVLQSRPEVFDVLMGLQVVDMEAEAGTDAKN